MSSWSSSLIISHLSSRRTTEHLQYICIICPFLLCLLSNKITGRITELEWVYIIMISQNIFFTRRKADQVLWYRQTNQKVRCRFATKKMQVKYQLHFKLQGESKKRPPQIMLNISGYKHARKLRHNSLDRWDP